MLTRGEVPAGEGGAPPPALTLSRNVPRESFVNIFLGALGETQPVVPYRGAYWTHYSSGEAGLLSADTTVA